MQKTVGIGVVEEANAMEPVRFLGMPNTPAANKILSRYGTSVVKSDPAAGIKGDTYVIGYPLHLASMTNVSDKTVYTMLKAWWGPFSGTRDDPSFVQTLEERRSGAGQFHRALSFGGDSIL